MSNPIQADQRRRSKRLGRWAFLGLLPFAVMVVAFQVVPLLSMIGASFRPDDGAGLSLQNYIHALNSAYYRKAIANSLLISAYASLIGIVIGLVCAYSVTRFAPAIRERLLMVSNMTSNFAGVPLAFAYIILLGANGIFTLLFKQWGWTELGQFDLYSWTGLILVYVYFQIPLALLLLYPAFYGIRDQWKEAAALLGAKPWQFWRTVGFPILAPAVFGTLGILFANAMGAYATAYALVGGNYNLLAVRIGSLVSGDVVNQPNLGSALAVLLALSTMICVMINQWMTKYSAKYLGATGTQGAPQGKRSMSKLRAGTVAKEEIG